ncbi:MAG: TetR/AcrR family transcriptional regulator [Tumebacillaceae bacterium]
MSPRNNEQNQLIRDERREQILSAAVKVFARRGLTGTKISDIAQAAGLSHGLVYHYFDSKDEIFTVLVERALLGSHSILSQASMQPGSPWEKLHWMTTAILSEEHYESSYYNYIMLQAFMSDSVPDALKARSSSLYDALQLAEHVVPILVAGQQAGQVVQDDPTRLASAMLSFLQGIILNRFESNDGPQIDADLVMRILKP